MYLRHVVSHSNRTTNSVENKENKAVLNKSAASKHYLEFGEKITFLIPSDGVFRRTGDIVRTLHFGLRFICEAWFHVSNLEIGTIGSKSLKY